MNWFTEKLKNRPWLMIVFLIMIAGMVGLGLVMLFLAGRRPVEEKSEPGIAIEQPPLSAPFLPTLEIQESAGEVVQKPVAMPASPSPKPAASPVKEPEAEEQVEPTPEPDVPLMVPFSDEEIFEQLFPDYYLDYLASVQRYLVDVGYLKSGEAQVFDQQKKIISFLDKETAYLLEIGYVDRDQYQKLKKGLNEDFVKLLELDVEYLRKGISLIIQPEEEIAKEERLLTPGQSTKLEGCGTKNNLSAVIWQQVKEFFGLPALAVGDCYRSGVSTPGGHNLWAPCCDCAIEEIPVGCLNAVCPYRPAIWDPMTGICGCG